MKAAKQTMWIRRSCSHSASASPGGRPPPSQPGISGGCEWLPWGTKGREAAKKLFCPVSLFFVLFLYLYWLTSVKILSCSIIEEPGGQDFGWHRCHTLLLLKADVVLMMCQNFAANLPRGVQIAVSQQGFNKLCCHPDQSFMLYSKVTVAMVFLFTGDPAQERWRGKTVVDRSKVSDDFKQTREEDKNQSTAL